MNKEHVRELFSFGGEDGKEYTVLVSTTNANEWNVAHWYNPETKTWDAGNYAYSLEGMLLTCLEKLHSIAIKSKYQMEIEKAHPDLDYSRIVELATLFKDGLEEDDEREAGIYFDEVCEMTKSQKEFFGIETEDDDDESVDED